MSMAYRACCVCVGLALLLRASADAQVEPPRTPAPATERPPDPRQREKVEFFRDRIGSVRLTIVDAPERPCQYVAEPVAKFDNPISQIEDGFMFLWTNRGRPVACVKS